MMQIERICLLGFGEVGSILAEELLANTQVELRVWDNLLHVAGSAADASWQALANHPRVQAADTATTAAEGCQLVLSAVTADEAIAAAQSVLPGLSRQSWFVDLNSVSPVTKQHLNLLMEQVGGRFVEAAIMSPITPAGCASPILLSGPEAKAFVSVGGALGFSALRAVSESLGTASATKMCRSVIIKGMEALVTESLVAARYYGVEDAVLESLDNMFPRPDWPQHAHYLISRSLQHGARRAAEMSEAAKTVTEAGLDAWMSDACSRRQDWAAQFKTPLAEEELTGLLEAIQTRLDQANSLKSNAL